MEDEYDSTLAWAEQEEMLRASRGNGVSTFYLITASIIIFAICFMILFYSGDKTSNKTTAKSSSIDLMNKTENILFEDFSNTELDEVPIEGKEGEDEADE